MKKQQRRFWNKVKKSATCWEWQGTKSKQYGIFYAAPGRKIRAHRYSYSLHFGDIPENMCICHTCDNPPCVNPEHLFLGTQADNIADMVRKNRACRPRDKGAPIPWGFMARGEQSGRSKLTTTQVLSMRAEYALNVSTKVVLSKKYKVSLSQVKDIINRIYWQHV